MKGYLSIVAVGALAFCTLGFPSCGEIYHSVTSVANVKTSSETTAQIIVNAEKFTAIGADTFAEFLREERRYSTEVKTYAPKVHKFAESLRQPSFNKDGTPKLSAKGNPIPRYVDMLQDLRTATKTFKANRTKDNEANLRTIYATVSLLINETKDNFAQVQSLKAP